jgi:type I restriction enzyme, S subunit
MKKNDNEEVRESTPRTKTAGAAGRVPRLRFPEFRDKKGWPFLHGDELFDSIVNKDHCSALPILAISQEFGAIPREDIDYNVVVTDKSIESYKVVEIGDFIISLRSFQGGIEYSKYRGICSPAYIILRKKIEAIEDQFFKYYFKTNEYINALNKNIEGIRDGKMVSYAQFSDIYLPFPCTKEQQKIAACLSSLDELIAAHERKLDALTRYKKGLMQQLFPVEGETVPRLRFPEFRDAGEWTTSEIGSVATVASGGTPARSCKEYWNGHIAWVTTSLINFNRIVVVDEFISKQGLDESSAKIFPKDTVLMAMYGQGVTRGKVSVLGIEAATNQACAAIIPSSDISFCYLFYFLSSRYEAIRKISNSGGQENLSEGLIKKIPFSFPINMPEQQKIASCLSSLDSIIAAQSAQIEALKRHKRGLMQGLFPVFDEAD